MTGGPQRQNAIESTQVGRDRAAAGTVRGRQIDDGRSRAVHWKLTWKLMSTRLPDAVVVMGMLLPRKMPIWPVLEFTLGTMVQLPVRDPGCTSESLTVKTAGL